MDAQTEYSIERLVSALLDGDAEAGAANLAAHGYARPLAAFENLKRIIAPLGPGMEAESLACLLLETLDDSADRDMALANWDRLFAAYFGHAGLASLLLGDPQLTERLSRLFGHSQYLADILLLNPEYVEWLGSPVVHSEKPLAVYRSEMAAAVELFREMESRRAALCRYHRREMLRIGLRDLMQWAPLESVTAELSDLAQATVETALALCAESLQSRFGAPQIGEGPASCGFAVIAMGKLGGRELNFSSDIDLIFIYESPGVTSGVRDHTGAITRVLSNQEYFAKLGAALIDFLSRHGPEGHLYRVDMRLRPDGASGPLAHSFAACQNYYLGRARLWERIALLKARGIAGDPALIAQFESLAAGFVFAPASPAALLDEVLSLKSRIDDGAAQSETGRREIKRGRGGIREIEFIVAALEILHGQTRSNLRERSTLGALRALAAERILAPDDAALLESAYRFFRRIEHALQCMAWQQTHLIPDDRAELAALAHRCGIRCATPAESAEAFRREHQRLADAVHALFEDLFQGDAKRIGRPPAALLRILDPDCSRAEAAETLAQWRLRDPNVVESLRRLARGSPTLFVSAEGQRRFEHLLPALLEACRRAPRPDKAVHHLEGFIHACGDAGGYYRLFDENPSILNLLVTLFGSSSQMAQTVIGNPGWFEPLIAPETFESPAAWLGQAGRQLIESAGASPAERLRAMRDLTTLASLRIAVRYLVGLAAAPETAAMLSLLADCCIETAAAWARDDIVPGAGSAESPPLPFAVLALGKLGRRELTFFSDLDLVFVSDPTRVTNTLPADPTTLFARMAERLIYYLTEPTAHGMPYRVDTRLRPEGANSPLVATLEGFRRHFGRGPEVWEIQTYLGGRVVAGHRQLGQEAFDTVFSAIPGLGASKDVAAAIRSMRGRLETTVVNLPAGGGTDFKRGPGGLVDLEFIAQYLQILHFGADRNLAWMPPREVLEMAGQRGWFDAATVRSCLDDYDFLRRLEMTLRLILETRQTVFPADPAELDALVHAIKTSGGVEPSGPGAPATLSPAALQAEFQHRLQRVRFNFDRILPES